MRRLVLGALLLLPLSGCMTFVQTVVGEAPAFMGGTRLWAHSFGTEARGQGTSAGRYAFMACDLPLSVIADLVLTPLTIPCEVAHDWQIEVFELHVAPW